MAGIHTAKYQRDRAAKRREWARDHIGCHICGQPIDYTLPATDLDHFQLDHIKPRIKFPDLANDPTNWAPSHASCNKRKSDGEINVDIGVTSEIW